MKQNIVACLSLFVVLSSACSSTSETRDPSPAGRRQQYVAKGDCLFESCGSVPSTFAGEAKVECASSDGNDCEWDAAENGDDDVVSYARCEDSECPPRPAIDCPGNTVSASQQCGNENDAGCAWTTVCTPPRETTPCPSQTGCDGQPVAEIGVICSDGSSGGFVCVSDGDSCYWERSCD
jgi:hypothetical protein